MWVCRRSAAWRETPCLGREFVETRLRSQHPNLQAPVAYLGGDPLAPLLRGLVGRRTALDLARGWPLPLETGLSIAAWLAARGVLERRSRRESGSRRLARHARARALPPLLEQNEVDLPTLRLLKEADLKELGLPFGPRKRILNTFAEQSRGVEIVRPPANRNPRRPASAASLPCCSATWSASRSSPTSSIPSGCKW